MLNGTDRRVRRTRGALLRAFDQLVVERSYARVTVNDIVTRADVGRSTFYEHFGSKEDILEECAARPLSLLANAVDPGACQADVLAVVEHFGEQSRLARKLLDVPTRRLLARVLSDLIESRLAKRFPPARAATALPTKHVATTLAEVQLAMLEAWLSGRVDCTPEELARIIFLSSSATLAALLGAR